ncbi:MAG: ATP-binding protein [Candidatus Eisenbacteria bacterium]
MIGRPTELRGPSGTRGARRPFVFPAIGVAAAVALLAAAGGLVSLELSRRAAAAAERQQIERWWNRLEADLTADSPCAVLPIPAGKEPESGAWQAWVESVSRRLGRPLCRIQDAEGKVRASSHWPASVGMQLAQPEAGSVALLEEPLVNSARPAAAGACSLAGTPGWRMVSGVFLDNALSCPWSLIREGGEDARVFTLEGPAGRPWSFSAHTTGGSADARGALPVALGAILAGACTLAGLRASGSALGRMRRTASRLHPDLVSVAGSSAFAGDEMELLLSQLAGERTRLAAQLRAARRLAGWRSAGRTLAHEVRNALTPIRISLEMSHLAEGLAPDPDLIREALRALDAAEMLLAEFSDFARLPEGARTSIDLRGWLPGVVRRWLPGRQVALTLPEGPLFVEADGARLERAAGNLLRNASEAAGEGEIRVALISESARTDSSPALEGLPRGGRPDENATPDAECIHFARIRVWNAGSHLPPDLGSRILAGGMSTKPGGSGLGLDIARSIALQMGGSLEFHNAEGGVAFDLRLVCIAPLQEQRQPEGVGQMGRAR